MRRGNGHDPFVTVDERGHWHMEHASAASTPVENP